MERKDNYAIQVQQAKQHFLTYDQQAILQKHSIAYDDTYLYPYMLGKRYRLSRATGDLQRQEDALWLDANTHAEVMTLLDWLCDSRVDRHLSGQWNNMQNFGLLFHRNLLEDRKDPTAALFDRHPEALHKACRDLGGKPLPGCDIGYAIELFDGLCIALQFWAGDEEFAPRLRWLWDENALQYLRYETMYFAVGLLTQRLTDRVSLNLP